MNSVNGNILATVQVKAIDKNALGEGIESWQDYTTLEGWLDYQGGSAEKFNTNAKLKETTDVFICDYVQLPSEAEIRLLIDDKHYEVLMIDDPVKLHYHYEIYLKYEGE